MACFHRISGTLIPLQCGAGVVSDWPLATHIEQTITLACACVVKAFDELTVLEELFALAFFMDGLTIEHRGTQVRVE